MVDLGAGTGKLTRRLTASGAALLAIEPVAAMRATFARLLPAVPVLGGAAEAILRDASAQAVVVGTAFHWFDGPTALAELHRVLSPAGAWAWSGWRGTRAWIGWPGWCVWWTATSGATRLVTPEAPGAGCSRRPPGVRFTPLQAASFPFAHSAPRETALQRVASTSFVGALSEDERQEVLRRARDLLDCHPQTQGRQTIDLPYTADLYWCTRTTA